MLLNQENRQYESIKPCTTIGVIYLVLDLGTQTNQYQGETSIKRQVRINWELPNEFMEDGRPFVIGKTCTMSLYETATLRKLIESMRGKPLSQEELETFQTYDLLGMASQLNIVHSDDGKPYINSIVPLLKGMETPKLHNEPIHLSLCATEYNDEAFEKVTKYWQDKIKTSPEWLELQRRKHEDLGDTVINYKTEEIPF